VLLRHRVFVNPQGCGGEAVRIAGAVKAVRDGTLTRESCGFHPAFDFF